MFRHIITKTNSDIADSLNAGQCGHASHPASCKCNTSEDDWQTLEDFADQMA